MRYPKEPTENLRYRLGLIHEAERDERVRNLAIEMFHRDVLFAFNTFFWAYDPRKRGSEVHRPIITYGYQDRVIVGYNEAIEAQENTFTDKSRDMLATYMVLLTYLWRWLVKDAETFRVGSWKEDFVDQAGIMDSLFEKLRYNLRKLPWWLLPKGRLPQMPSRRLLNEANGSTIVGELANSDFARSGRNTAVLFDELQSWEMAHEAWKSASDSTRCKMALGTPKGAGNKFAELARTSEVRRKFHLIWYENPEKAWTSKEYLRRMKAEGYLAREQSSVPVFTGYEKELAVEGCFLDVNGKLRSQWYDEEVERRGGPNTDDVKENLDCSYLTSGNPYFDVGLCEKNLRLMSREPEYVGNLMWKIAPVFNERGDCVNFSQLEVEFVPNQFGMWSVWKKPEGRYDNGYCIACDVAEGLEQGDFTSVGVLDRRVESDTSVPTEVATLHQKLPVFELAEELAKVGVWYGRAYISVERNKEGSAVIYQLFKIYPKIWHKEVLTKGYPELADKMGFETSNRHVKSAVCGELSKAVSFREFVSPDETLWRECMTFVNDNGRLEAQGKTRGDKCYDDVVMKTAILWWTHNRLPAATRIHEKQKVPRWMQRQQYEPNLVGFVVGPA